MKIVKRGSEKTFVAQCPSCATDMEYTLEDVKNHEIVCPECGHQFCASLLTREDADNMGRLGVSVCPPFGKYID